jgi:hypothetical protein
MTSAIRPTLAHTFRRAALPLGWYYAVTLALPLANGAARSGDAFFNHALVVLVVPLIFIALVCVIRKAGYVLATVAAGRSRQRPTNQ